MKTSTTGLRFANTRAFRWELPIAVLMSWFLAVVATSQTYEIVHAFRNSGQPRSDLIETNGDFYGTTYFGGRAGVGSIFRMDQGGNLTILHSFAYADGAFPAAGLLLAADGNFYGTASLGGASNLGTAFRMDSAGRVARLHSFGGDDGAQPYGSLIQATDGVFYGTTSSGGASGFGSVYRMDSEGNVLTLYSFTASDGIRPFAGIIEGSDGNFYGTASAPIGSGDAPGIIFKMDTSGHLTVLHTFSVPDGWTPVAPLMQATDGNFYGTTFSGGSGNGTIFRIDSSGNFATLVMFDGVDFSFPLAGLIQGTDGYLYGTAYGGYPSPLDVPTSGVFKVDLSGNVSPLHRFTGGGGTGARAALVQTANGAFYGTTSEGGSANAGTIFKIDSQGNFVSLHSFVGVDGIRPQAALLQTTSGDFYGTTERGGASDRGTVFRMDSWGGVRVIHSFDGIAGAFPAAALMEATDGSFYGTTSDEPTENMGTIFKIDPDQHFTTVHTFTGPDGSAPRAALLQAANGDLYGTTSGDGQGRGTIFRLATGNFETVVHFPVDGGDSPVAPVAELIQAADGNFYGTSQGGGLEGTGTAFRLNQTGEIETLTAFGSSQALVESDDLVFYGTSQYWNGVFRLGAAGADFVHVFNGGAEGSLPDGLVLASDNYFYGTTYLAGANDLGTVFKMDAEGNVSLLHAFNTIDGVGPSHALIQASDGLLYGTRPYGGPLFCDRDAANGPGVVFRLNTAGMGVNDVSPSSGPASGGTAVDIVGGGFLAGVTVQIGDMTATDVAAIDPTFLYLFTPALTPGTLNDVSVTNPGSIPATATHPNAYFADFLDVPQTHPFHDDIEGIFRAGITAGCGGGIYCPDDSVTRAQMAVFLLKAEHGSGYVPPLCAGVFPDVPCPGQFADWIERLAAEGITAGCGGGNYCPTAPVSRSQMAVFLLKAEHGPGYEPPACTGIFGDVECPSLFANWVEQLASEGITGGCGGGNYCPSSPNTRGQMAVFLTKTFHRG